MTPVDLMVVAPHPDDEVIGCAVVIQQALAAGRRVRVAFMTSGGGNPQAADARSSEVKVVMPASG